jgi:hypothetical protein
MDKATDHAKRVLLVAQFDGYSNTVKPAAVERFLRANGHDIQVFNTYYLSRASNAPGTLRNNLPGFGLGRLAVYAVEAASLITRRWSFGRGHLSYYLLLADYRLRRGILGSSLPLDDFDLIICAHPQDAGLLTLETSALTFYDCPTPFADEVYNEGKLAEGQHQKFRRFEK